MRVAIVGGGIAGLGCAWLLEGSGHDVVVLEGGAYAGGHAHTQRIEYSGDAFYVDTACSTLTNATHPVFLRFLKLLDVPTDRAVGTVTAYSMEREQNIFVIPSREPRRVVNAIRFSYLKQLLRLNSAINTAIALEKANDWSVTVRQLMQRLPTDESRALMLPLLAGIVGTSQQEALEFSARAGMKFLVYPRLGKTPFSLERIVIPGGMTAYVQALLKAPHDFQLKLDCEIISLEKHEGGFCLRDARGGEHLVDRVVLATPAYLTCPLLATLPGTRQIRQALDRMRYYETNIYVHSDLAWMPKTRSSWSYVNFMVGHGGETVKSFWCSGSGAADVFRSWGVFRGSRPQTVHGHYRYMHPLMTPDYFSAQSQVNALSADLHVNGVSLAGSYLEDVDTHESGLLSAIDVVCRLALDARNLRRLNGLASVG